MGTAMRLEEVSDVKLRKGMNINDLIEAYDKIHGFNASHLAYAAKILAEGLRKSDLRFLAFTGNLIATGIRGIIAQLIDEGFFDIIITTCGSVDHDIARAFGGRYLKGSFFVDDSELSERGIHRLGNIFIPKESYGLVIERFTKELITELTKIKSKWSVSELLNKVGERLKDDINSFLGAAYRRGIKVVVPGITDGAFGTNLFIESQFTKLEVDLLKDMKLLSDLVFKSKTSAALIIGGGISKHHTIWWNQFKGGLDYAVYITTAIEWDGSLSGARTHEAISWGKIKPKAKHVTVYGDATIILPLIALYLIENKDKILK